MTLLVVDASVGVKWVLPEIHSDRADALRGPVYKLHAPVFFRLEVAGVLWKKVQRKELSAAEAGSSFSIIERSPVELHPYTALVPSALELAIESGRSVYDRLYLSLGEKLGMRVVTADQKLRNALRGTRWEQLILWVEDIPLS